MTPPKSLLPRKNSPKLPEDNLAGDLLRMIEDAYPGAWTKKKADLAELLTVYVVQRDGKVFNHGFELGRKRGVNELLDRCISKGVAKIARYKGFSFSIINTGIVTPAMDIVKGKDEVQS